MSNGFLDNLPDLGIESAHRPKKKQTEQKVVIYLKIKCPACGSPKCPAYDSSHLPVRYHKCTKCGHNFKSIEQTGV